MELPNILILDDEEKWLALHHFRLTSAGFQVKCKTMAKDAVLVAKTDPSIKFCLIDQILFDSQSPAEEYKRQLQEMQGDDVIRAIRRSRPDIQFIVITSLPQREAEKESDKFRIRDVLNAEESKLRRQPGVRDLIHKFAIENDPDREYGWLIRMIKDFGNPQNPSVPQNSTRILVGLGFQKEVFDVMLEAARVTTQDRISFRALLENQAYGGSNPELILKDFISKSHEKTVFIELPGSKKLDRIKSIKPNSQPFNILMFLATLQEKGENVAIQEDDYKSLGLYKPRKPRKARRLASDSGSTCDGGSSTSDLSDPEAEESSETDKRSIRDFAFEPVDGRTRMRSGVHIEKNVSATKIETSLKVAISRLQNQLVHLNVGSKGSLFRCEQGEYHPTFELGIVLYVAGSFTRRRY